MAGVTVSRREYAAAWARSVARRHDGVRHHAGRRRSVPGGRWERPGGGGGVARILAEGQTFEKAGVNRSVVEGQLPGGMAHRLGAAVPGDSESRFFAAGVSLVIHPRSPMVPTVHLNVRYFELAGVDGNVHDAWLGGGTDLTPTYPFPDDAVHFHRALRELCDRHHAGFYARFKRWCDEYFVNVHRGGERRGVGGIFFDNLRGGDFGRPDQLFAFAPEVGRVLPAAYGPIVERRRDCPPASGSGGFSCSGAAATWSSTWSTTGARCSGCRRTARAESVLMSLPPLASWEYAPAFQPGSFEAELMAMLEPRDWVR